MFNRRLFTVSAGIGLAASTSLAARQLAADASSSKATTKSVAGPLPTKTMEGMPGVEYAVSLYQYETCPFCCKTRTYLNWRKVPYVSVEVNPLSKKEVAFTTYDKVPFIVTAFGEQITDSSNIISTLEERITGSDAFAKDEEVVQWRKWVDASLIKTLPPNIYRTITEAWNSMDYLTAHAKLSQTELFLAKTVGTVAMYAIGKKIKHQYGFQDERQALYDHVNQWADYVKSKGTAFAGGKQPNVADVSVFGVLQAIRQLPVHSDMMQNSRINEWYAAMDKAVGAESRVART